MSHSMHHFGTIAIVTLFSILGSWNAQATTITVNTALDTATADGLCSLREAILAANSDATEDSCGAGSGEDHIDFDLPFPATILLSDHLPPITDSVALHGPGAAKLTLDGNDFFRAITIEYPSTGIWLVVQRLTLAHGRTPVGGSGGGGAMIDGGASALFERVVIQQSHSTNSGGGLMVGSGIDNISSVTLVECLFEGNVAEGPGGGGGLSTPGTGSVVTIVRSAFVDNEAPAGSGGGLLTSRGFVTIQASTLSGNSAAQSGGAVYSSTAPQGGASLTIRDSTIVANTAGTGLVSAAGGGIYLAPGIEHPLAFTIENSVVAENFDLVTTDNPDLFCGPNLAGVAATGSNLVGANDGCASFFPTGRPNVNGDFVGSVATAISPGLTSLSDNGGPTPTHRPSLNPPSALVDQGSCADALTDQRGFGTLATGLRLHDLPNVANAASGDGCDIGAYEVLTDSLLSAHLFADGFETGNRLRWPSEAP